MGLLDVLNGMQNGPRGPREPGDGKGGMSPLTMAILGLLAYKAIKHVTGGSAQTAPANPAPAPVPAPSPTTTTANSGNAGSGWGDLMKGPLGGTLGGLLGGAAAGSVLSGGLGDLLRQFQQNGHEDTVNSWVGNGPNKQISPDDLANALGADQIETLSAHTGLSREELLSGLAQQLPDVVHHLTPDGRLPTAEEAARWI